MVLFASKSTLFPNVNLDSAHDRDKKVEQQSDKHDYHAAQQSDPEPHDERDGKRVDQWREYPFYLKRQVVHIPDKADLVHVMHYKQNNDGYDNGYG